MLTDMYGDEVSVGDLVTLYPSPAGNLFRVIATNYDYAFVRRVSSANKYDTALHNSSLRRLEDEDKIL